MWLAVVVQSPNFFWRFWRHCRGIADARARSWRVCWSLRLRKAFHWGAVKPPAEADIVAMEAQSFGLPPSYGGAVRGGSSLRATNLWAPDAGGGWPEKLPTRKASVDFVLTLATPRTAHPAREGHIEYLH